MPPPELRVFRARDWNPELAGVNPRLLDPRMVLYEHQLPAAEQAAVARIVAARRRWSTAQEEWAAEHGYRVRGRYSPRTDQNWQDFLRPCRAAASPGN